MGLYGLLIQVKKRTHTFFHPLFPSHHFALSGCRLFASGAVTFADIPEINRSWRFRQVGTNEAVRRRHRFDLL